MNERKNIEGKKMQVKGLREGGREGGRERKKERERSRAKQAQHTVLFHPCAWRSSSAAAAKACAAAAEPCILTVRTPDVPTRAHLQ